jgi:hypothetical protein
MRTHPVLTVYYAKAQQCQSSRGLKQALFFFCEALYAVCVDAYQEL